MDTNIGQSIILPYTGKLVLMLKFEVSRLLARLALGCFVATICAPVEAHGVTVPLPTTHAVATANALKALLLRKSVPTLPIASTGSATVRLNNQILKSLVTRGYSNGQNLVVSQQVGGLIKSGGLNGTLYFGGLGTYVNGGPFYVAVGSNPFNNGSTGVFTNVPSTTYLSFSASSILKQHGIGSVLPYSGGVSGASRARTALYKQVTTSATIAGEKSIGSLGPITGGEFFGAFGQASGGVFSPTITAALAFGSNRYNSAAFATLPSSALANYLTFANGTTRAVTGGQLIGTGYYGFVSPPISFGCYGIAFGNSPFNNVLQSYSTALIKDAAYLAALK